MNRRLLITALGALACAATLAGACGGDDGDGDASGTGASGPGLEDVIYEGGATDEALTALLAAAPKVDAAQAAVLDTPAEGAALPGDPAPELAWHVGGGGARALRPHGDPINGRAYFLAFSTPERQGVVLVFTTRLTYTPDAAAWATLRAAGGPITARLVNAVFENNRIAPEGGPFVGGPVTFSIEP